MSAEFCRYRADNGYKEWCGEPATSIVWGEPCSCTDVYGHATCSGHNVCEAHAMRLRADAVPIAAKNHEAHSLTFKPTRICSLVSS